MAFKFILGHHIKGILNDAEEKQKRDIKEYAGGHLNESLLLKTELVLGRKTWESARAPNIKLVQATRPVHKPIKKQEKGHPHEALFDFSLGTAGVIPPAGSKEPKTSDVRYKLIDPDDPSPLPHYSDNSVYSQLEDGVLIEEMPPQELMMRAPRPRARAPAPLTEDADIPGGGDVLNTSHSSPMSRQVMSPMPLNYNLVPMHSKGLTRKDQYRRMKAFDATVLQKRELVEQKVLSGERAARHHEFKLEQDLEDLNLNGIGPNFHRLQVFSNVLEDVIDESPTFNYVLGCIKTEYDNYIAKLLDGQQSQQHILRDQVDHMAERGTSRPDDMQAAMDKLHRLEKEGKHLLDMNTRLRDDVATETELLNKEPEHQRKKHRYAARRTSPSGGFSKKEEKVELSLELEHMKALILEKMDELAAMRVKLREEFVPMTVCTHLEQCIKETEVEVQKLLKQNEYFERSIAEMDHDLKEAIVEADTSEKDARRIWHKVNSTRGLPGQRQGTEMDSDGEDDETKWNWYIS